jgi:hypothetical protein
LAQIKDDRLNPVGHILFVFRQAFVGELQPFEKLTGVAAL